MSRSKQIYEDLQESQVQQRLDQAEDHQRWVNQMQELANSLRSKKCPYCHKGNCLEPIGLNEFICTKCDNTGFTSGLFN